MKKVEWLLTVVFVAAVGAVFWLLRAMLLPRALWNSDAAGALLIPALLAVAAILFAIDRIARALRRPAMN